jgi:phosphoribosylanthranilate isomerase
MVRIKVCGITSREDALAAVEAGADALGFNFYRPSPRYVTPSLARSIIEALPPEVLCVGVFVNEESPEAVGLMASESGVTSVQLHGDESPEFCAALWGGRGVIKALRVGASFAPEQASGYPADAILLDSLSRRARGGTGETFDWSLARRTRELVSELYLAGGLTPENVGRAVRAVRPFAVDVCSGVELSPGRKSPELMRRFAAEARAAAEKLDAPPT